MGVGCGKGERGPPEKAETDSSEFYSVEVTYSSDNASYVHMMTLDDSADNAELVAEQMSLLAHSHPCEVCGAESRYLWFEGGRKRQACEHCAPLFMKKRAA
jgi:hypothetical protein